MMKILVTSDTHGLYSHISNYIISNPDIDLLIHAGDGVEDVKNIAYETNIDYHVVRGNNDFFTNIAYDKILDINGYKIFLSHGHKYGVDIGYSNILKVAKNNGCDIAIHGHTHIYYQKREDEVLLLNPGSPSLPRDNNPGFLIMELEEDLISIKRIKISEVN